MSIIPRLNRFDLTMIVISLVIGMGIFANPSEVAVRAGSTWIFFGAWLFGGLVTLCGALTFAEIGARYPHTGGFYKVFSYCYHPAFAFMINWVLVISNAASVAVVAIIGANYINPVLLPPDWQSPLYVQIVAVVSVLILYALAFLGIKVSARTQNLLTLFKVLAILVLCGAVFMHDDTHMIVKGLPNNGNIITALGLSLVPIFFTYGGYQQTINFGGDIIEPKRNIPKAIGVGIGVVIFLYLSINFTYYKVLGLGGLQQTTTLAATMAGVIFGSIGSKIASVLMFVSVLAYINVNVMSNPRVYYAMSEDGILPYIFRKVNPKTQVQEFGVTFFVLCILVVLFFADSFRKMLDYVMFFDTIGLSLAALSIFILRKRTKQLDGTGIYTIKWFPLVPVIFILSYWFVTLNIFWANPGAAFVCLGVFALGLAIYYLSVYLNKGKIPTK
ncbi:APC family permease [Mucilaginibacter boryungensis]|uniref:Amino acid permease n=1 Tax=Mucilaginibacter boryungensis TaxID=768480 RepID=A0ABR9XJZ6_9SPHI|nr:amino acid permease [Mucilaginibacter boryungensis]MBE9667330.1 amino acid permease [Mucilaginibacter boryungensis]